MTQTYNIAIIGGGIVGNAIARELSRYELKTILIEKEIEVSFGTSKANSGIIHSALHDDMRTLKGRLCLQGNALWGKLSKELRIPFERVGEILVARSRDDIPTLKKMLENAKANGIPAEMVEGKRLHELEPNLSVDINTGLLAPSAGVIPPYEMTYALYENAMQNGVEYLLESKVTNIAKEGASYVISAGNREIKADHVINAAGVYADEVAKFVGADNFTIKPRKGEEYILDKRLDNINNHIIFPTPTATSKGILIIKTIEGSTMIGPTAEDTDDREDTSTTSAGLTKILDFVRTMIHDIPKKDIIASFAGIRPVSDTNDFIIEESVKASRFINAAGIQSPGLTAAPAIALMVVNILRTTGLQLEEKKEFKRYDRPHRRFSLAPDRDKELLIGLNKAYGNVICRCETVTEAEVVAAIKNGARTIDGIKLRTRAGMGRCQAGFCTHHVMRILAKETGIPEEKITKRGGHSEIVKEKR
jgi:glycerol-3-phosphate dehydrogenase